MGTLTALPYIRSGESYCMHVEGAPLAPCSWNWANNTSGVVLDMALGASPSCEVFRYSSLSWFFGVAVLAGVPVE